MAKGSFGQKKPSKSLNRKAVGGGARSEAVDYEHRMQAYGTPVVKGRKTPVPEVADGEALTSGNPKDGWI